jgi:hypothetical protein
MRDPVFRQQQWDQRYAAHVAPLNRWIDAELNANAATGTAPYIPPLHGGVNASVVALLRDPGPKADGDRGSGFLAIENDDSTAETMCLLFQAAGIAATDVTPWNAYPWYINAAPTATQLDSGLAPLGHVLALVEPRAVLLLGRHAQRAWRHLGRRHPNLAAQPELVASTYHPSRQALFHPDPGERERRVEHRAATIRAVGEVLAAPTTPAL